MENIHHLCRLLKMIATEWIGIVVTLSDRILEVRGSNLGRGIGWQILFICGLPHHSANAGVVPW